MSKPYELKILKYLENYRDIAKKVKEIAKAVDPNAKVFVFGSTARGRYTALSDIDILVIVKEISKKYEIMVNVYKEIEAPVELHIITEELFKKWYKKFVDPNELIEV